MQAPAAQQAQRATFEARRRVATVAQAADAYPAFSQAALRDLIFKSEDRFNSKGDRIKGNGLAEAGAIIRIGRKVLLDLDAFDAWLGSRAKAQGRAA